MMTKKYRIKITMIAIALLVLLLGMTGCRQTPPPQEEEEAPATVEEVEEPESPEELIQVLGRYVGFADSNSVEIELIDEAEPFMVFQLADSVREQLEENEFATGTEVIVIYRALAKGQPMMMEIKAK